MTVAVPFPARVRDILDVVEALRFTTGSTFYVHATTGANTNGGTSPTDAVADLNTAVGLCTASKGDVIFLMPGHVESLAAAANVDLDVAGITVIGLGNGPDRPRFDYDAVDAVITIGANGVTLKNITCRPSIALTVVGINIETGITDTLLEDIEAVPGEAGDGTDEFVDFITVQAGCTRTHINGLKYSHHASAGGSQTAISLVGASDRVHIENCWIEGSGAGWVAPIQGITTLSTRILINDCVLTCDAEPGIELLTGTTGTIKDVDIFSNLATVDAATVADGCAHFRVRYVEVGNESDAVVKTASVSD